MAIYYQEETRNIQRVNKMNKAVNLKDVSKIAQLFASGYHYHPRIQNNFTMDKAHTLQMFTDIFNAYPDYHEELVHIFVYRNWIGSFYVLSGTFTQPFRGRPPTGQHFEVQSAIRAKFDRYGLQIEAWGYVDNLSWLQQVGVIP